MFFAVSFKFFFPDFSYPPSSLALLFKNSSISFFSSSSISSTGGFVFVYWKDLKSSSNSLFVFGSFYFWSIVSLKHRRTSSSICSFLGSNSAFLFESDFSKFLKASANIYVGSYPFCICFSMNASSFLSNSVPEIDFCMAIVYLRRISISLD